MSTQQALPAPRFDTFVQGSGPALLLAHGAGGGIEGNFGYVLEDLSRDHALVGPHYPGAGSTPVDDAPLQIDDLADQLVASAVAAGHESFTVVGESLGTAVSIRIAARHPERVRALVLTAGFAKADPSLGLTAELIKVLTAAGERRSAARVALVGVSTEDELARLSDADLEQAVDAVQAGMPPGMADHFDLVSRVDVREDLAGIAVPTLVLSPAEDRMVLPESSRRLARGIVGAELIDIPGGGHVLSEERRAVWLGHVREFLARVGV